METMHQVSTPGKKATLHYLCGKMAAGKSTLARKLAVEYDAVLICEDLWLSRMYQDSIVSFDDYFRCAARLKTVVGPHVTDLLRKGVSVVLDFPGNTPQHRAWFRELFEAAQAEHALHFVDLPDAHCKVQLQKRNQEQPEGSKVMSEADFDYITSYFVAPAVAEGFFVQRHLPVGLETGA